jgi:hypothetical protein
MKSTKLQAPAFAEAASRRQAKFQINPPACRQAGMTQFRNHKQSLLGYLTLEFGAYLEFGIWGLELDIKGNIHA